ncbi:AidA/PixA family protein [Pandoraea anhela]|uniref:Inclusion body protein n=1 Tax=Pandoraea anhela TaxID=2508295 RepID=A0A5E4RH51_9BURK|nr:AidA/PixA family protein [Pandoraea anhela]VVD61862.1 inclusion body protein [Pandoraea anhela]
MSDAQTCGTRGDGEAAADRVTVIDVLLAIDTATLLDKTDGHTPSATVDGSDCYRLSPGRDALSGESGTGGARWCIDVRPGQRLRIRWTPLAMRGEHAVLLQLALADETTLHHLRLHVEDKAVRYAPGTDTPTSPVAREATDAFWQADVVASGDAELTAEAIVTDREANVLGRFSWSFRMAVP